MDSVSSTPVSRDRGFSEGSAAVVSALRDMGSEPKPSSLVAEPRDLEKIDVYLHELLSRCRL
jgi:hypothetical protein